MILINLLPPELRKKRGTVNPLLYAVAACWILAVVPSAGCWYYLQFDRLPASQRLLEEETERLAVATKAAEDVAAMEVQIAEAQSQFDTVQSLVGQKMYWAPLIDDFANHLTGQTVQWSGFEVCCTDLTIQASSGDTGRRSKDAPAPTAVVKGKFKLLGNEPAKAGDYIRAFFSGTQNSAFWNSNGFVGKPEASYPGDTPKRIDDIGRVSIDMSLDWTRQKVSALAADKKKTGKADR